MMKKKDSPASGLDIAGLLALKAFERPSADRIEKNIQSTMRAVRTAHSRPSLHYFPDKSLGWMFAQPRYGIAALFVIFLGLHLMQRPMPDESVGASVMSEPGLEMDLSAVTQTNRTAPILPPIPASSRPAYSSLVKPVSFSE
jgi:hypothetical protein